MAFFATPFPARCLSPIIQYQDLVAGEGEAGFANGPYYLAQFNHPKGLATSPDGTTLYVADQQNNLIRAIQSNKKNTVETLAGTGTPGNKDGLLLKASFNQPSDLVSLSNGQIAVNDKGNNSIRLINLIKNEVTTLNDASPLNLDSDKRQDGVFQVKNANNLAYLSSLQCLFVTQPESGILLEIDLATHEIKTILRNNPSIPHPFALAAGNGKLFASDRDLPGVYEVQLTGEKPEPNPKAILPPLGSVKKINLNPMPRSEFHVSIKKVGQAHDVVALAMSGDSLYACQADEKNPILRILPKPKTVSFIYAFPENKNIQNPGSLLPHFRGGKPGVQLGFTGDPRSEGRFFIINPNLSILIVRVYVILNIR